MDAFKKLMGRGKSEEGVAAKKMKDAHPNEVSDVANILESAGATNEIRNGDSNAILNVAILLDITGSMGNQIDGVRRMISEYCQQEDDTSIIKLHILTFTESSKKSYVSHFTSDDRSKLKNYVDNIRLSRPPDFPYESAHGEDGPENILHGLASLKTKIPSDEGIVCFLITDSCIHFKSDSGSTARREREALQAMGFGPNDNGGSWDGFAVLNEILAQHSGKLLIVPLLYGHFHDVEWHWHCQAAVVTGGRVLRASDRRSTSTELAAGMRIIVRGIIEARYDTSLTVESIPQDDWTEIGKAFSFYDLEEFDVIESEPSGRRRAADDDEPAPTIRSMDRTKIVTAQQSLMGLFQTVVNIEGRKFKKRLKNVKVETSLYSAQFVCHLARLFVDQYNKDYSDLKKEGDKKESEEDVKKVYLLGLQVMNKLDAEYKEVFGKFLRKIFVIENKKASPNPDDTESIISVHLNMSQIIKSCEEGLSKHPKLVNKVEGSDDVSRSSIVSLETIREACAALPVTLDQSMQGVFENLATIGEKISTVDDIKIGDKADVKKIASDLQKVEKELEEIDYNKIDVARDVMGCILRLIHVLLVDIRFPTDPTTKQPDFYDSYSTQINDVGISVLTAHDAMMLRKETGNDTEFRDPQMQTKSFNAALPLVYLNDNKENDVVAKFIFQMMSSLPLLDQITTYLVSGDPNIFPNINAGVLASLTYHVFNNQESGLIKPVKNQTEAYKQDKQLIFWMENNLMDSLLNSIECQSTAVGGKMIQEMKHFGQLNPKDAIPQLFAGIYWLWKKESKEKVLDDKSTYLRKNYKRILKFLMEEWVTAQIQKHDRYNNHIYKGAANADWLKNPSRETKENKEYKEINPMDTDAQNLFLRPEAVMDWHTFVSEMKPDFVPDDLTSNMHVLEILDFKRILDNKLELKCDDKTISKLSRKLATCKYFSKLYLKDNWEKRAENDLAKGHNRIFDRVKSGVLKFLEFLFANEIEVSESNGLESNSMAEEKNGIVASESSIANLLFSDFKTVFLESWMLKKRTQRYELKATATATQPLHRRMDNTELPQMCEFIIDYLRDIWSEKLSVFGVQRDTQVKSQLEQNIVEFISLNSNIEDNQPSNETCSTFLEENVIVLSDLEKKLKIFNDELNLEAIQELDRDSKVQLEATMGETLRDMFTYRLDRNDIVPLLERYAASKESIPIPLIRELIIGDSWTSVPPSSLKKHSELIKTEIFVGLLDQTNNQTVKEEIELLQKNINCVFRTRQAAPCKCPNEHGYSSNNRRPLLINTTEELELTHMKKLDECADARIDFAKFFGKALLEAKSDALLMLKNDPRAKDFKSNYSISSRDNSYLFYHESYHNDEGRSIPSAFISTYHSKKLEDEKEAVTKFLNYSVPGESGKTGKDYVDKVIEDLVRNIEEPVAGTRTLKRKTVCMREFIAICQLRLELSVAETYQLIQYVHFDKPSQRLRRSVNKVLKKVQQKRWKW